jgi:hypothetical protein
VSDTARHLRKLRTGQPTDLTEAVIDAIRHYQVVKDPDPIRAALAVAATSVLEGEPVWLQLVGGPSSGKSEAISMLRTTVDGRIGEITPAGLLSWQGRGAKRKPGGALARMGDGPKLLTISDFSTLLADSDRGRRSQLFSMLRTLYDGFVYRDIDGGRLSWEGRATIVSGVTPQIDAFSAHTNALGPRWIYCRVPELDPAARIKAAELAREVAGRKERLRADAQATAHAAIDAARRDIGDVSTSDVDGSKIRDAAIVATLIRSDVPRETYGSRREISGEVTREEPFRMVTQLALLHHGLLALGVNAVVARRIVIRCAMDSAPHTRRRCLDALRSGERYSTNQVAVAVDADRRPVRFALEELQLLGLVKSERRGKQTNADDEDDDPGADRRARDWWLDGDEAAIAASLLEEVSRSVG